MRTKAFALAVASATLLAGCLGADPEDTDTSSVADPTDDATPSGDVATATENATSPSDLTGGHSPHIHNYWGESDRLTLFDGDTKITVQDRWAAFRIAIDKRPVIGTAHFELPDGATVYEGSGELVVTPAWTSPSITGLAMRYHSPDMASGWNSWSEWLPLASGIPTSIEVAPEMTDMPHDAKSRWAFEFSADGAAGAAEGNFHLTFEIVRVRDIALFPGHPDTYEDTDRYLLGDEDYKATGSNRAVQFVGVLTTGEFDEDVYRPSKGIPMETRALILTVKINSGGTTSPLAKQSGIALAYTSAETRRDYDAQLLNNTEGVFVFAVPVDDTMVDSPYREGTAWHFHIQPRQQPLVPNVRDPNGCDGCVEYELDVHVTLEAFDHDPTGGQIDPRGQPRQWG
ncbi:MAG TPA: hypothetical protein VI997_02180 [Candidatus Thermoplasmatota archaeon]|nr:hypothetical protein [Candidatus Thermoplasmatota archaeon]